MVDEQLTIAVGDVEVVGHHALPTDIHWLFIEGTEAGAVQLGQHLHLVGGNIVHVKAVAHAPHLIGTVATEEERIVRHIEEVLAEVGDDVYALVGGLRESLRRLHIGLRPLVVGIGDALHTVLVHKEIVYLCHIAHILGAGLLRF